MLDTLEVTEAQLGSLVGRSDRTIRRWVKAGRLQHVAPGRLRLVDALPAVVALIEEASDGSELQAERLRKLRAEASMAELDLARQRGLVASIAEFEAAQVRSYGLVQHGVMQLPQRLAIRLLGESDEGRFKAAVKEEVRAVLGSAADEIQRANERLRAGQPTTDQDDEE